MLKQVLIRYFSLGDSFSPGMVGWGGVEWMGSRGGRGRVRLTIASLLKAMVRIPVTGQDGDFVSSILEADGGVDDETLCTADA